MKNLTFANGDQMPVIGLGTWKSKPGEVYQAVYQALKIGYRHIDCAAVYRNEKEIGQAISDAIAEGIASREELWITSKLWCDSFAQQDVEPALRQTLQDLQLDYLDLYLLHWPIPLRKGQGMSEAGDFVDPTQQPVSDTWRKVEEMKLKGLVRHIGVSNFTVKKLTQLIDETELLPAVNQVEMHPYLQQPELVSFCRNHQIHITGYSPLGSSDRPAPLKKEGEPVLLQDQVITEIAQQNSCTPAQVILSWAINYGISVIPKSVSSERLAENLKAVDCQLDCAALKAIAGLDKHRRYIDGQFWLVEGGFYSWESLWDGE